MDIQQRLIEYRSKVADKSNYPDVPDWVRELMVQRLTSLLAFDDPQEIGDRVTSFRQGATRAIADQCGAECDELLSDIPRA